MDQIFAAIYVSNNYNFKNLSTIIFVNYHFCFIVILFLRIYAMMFLSNKTNFLQLKEQYGAFLSLFPRQGRQDAKGSHLTVLMSRYTL